METKDTKFTEIKFPDTNSELLDRFSRVQSDNAQRTRNFNQLYNLFNGEAIRSALTAAEVSYIHNLLALTINDYTVLETSSFEIQIPPQENTDEGKHASDIVEKYLYAVWERNFQVMRVYDIMFFKNLYGEAPILSFPDAKYGIKITIADPRHCFPVMEEGTDNLWEMFLVQKRTNNQLRRWSEQFPDDYTKQDVLFYWNKTDYKVITTDGRKIWEGKHYINQVPWSIAKNPYYPGETGGFSSMEWTAGLCKYLNQLMSDLATIVHYNSAPQIIGEGTGLERNEWMTGPNAFNPIKKGGKVYPLVIGEPAMLSNHITRVTEHYNEASGLPGILHGKSEDSVSSEKAIKALSAGAEIRVELRRNLTTPALTSTNSHILMQTEKLHTKPIQFHTAKSSQSILELDPKTIKGNYMTSIQFPIGLLDYSSKVVTVLQLVNSKLMSKLRAMDLLQVRSPRDEQAQIKLEAEDDLQHEISLRQAATAAQPAAPEVAAPAATGGRPPGPYERPGVEEADPTDRERMERGSPQTRKEPIGRPHEHREELDRQVPTPEEKGRLVLNEIVRALASIEKVRGRIFIFGELVTRGWTDDKIDLMLTDMIDKQTILNGLPMWKGRFNFQRVGPEGKPKGTFLTVPKTEEAEEE